MASLYKRFLKICEMWPLDPNKVGRDLGAHLRQKVGEHFRLGEVTPVQDRVKCEQYYESLRRLAANYHGNKYHRPRITGAMGVNAERCSFVVSNKVLEEANLSHPSLLRRLKYVIFRESAQKLDEKELKPLKSKES